MFLWWFILLGTAAAAPCESPETLAEQSLSAVVEARLQDTRDLLDRTVVAWACSPAAQPDTLARYWLAEAALASFSSNPGGTEQAFGAARRVSPELWDDRLGAQLRESWTAAEQPAGEGSLKVTPKPIGPVMLDGVLVDTEDLNATVGLHLLQVLDAGGDARFARTLHVVAGQDVLVRTGLSEEGLVTELPESPPDFSRPTPVWLVAAGTAAVVGTAGAVAARSQRSAIQEATTVDEVDSALLQQKVMAGVAYTGAGVAVVSVALHFGTRKK